MSFIRAVDGSKYLERIVLIRRIQRWIGKEIDDGGRIAYVYLNAFTYRRLKNRITGRAAPTLPIIAVISHQDGKTNRINLDTCRIAGKRIPDLISPDLISEEDAKTSNSPSRKRRK